MKITTLKHTHPDFGYIVVIKDSVFEMGEYPDRANDVNIYMGEIKEDWEWYDITQGTTILPKIPKNLKYAIRERCKQIRAEELDKYEVY